MSGFFLNICFDIFFCNSLITKFVKYHRWRSNIENFKRLCEVHCGNNEDQIKESPWRRWQNYLGWKMKNIVSQFFQVEFGFRYETFLLLSLFSFLCKGFWDFEISKFPDFLSFVSKAKYNLKNWLSLTF